jgi:hypothetical protein
MPRVADWNLPAPAGSGSERRSLPMAQGRSEGSRSPMLAGIHTVSLLRVRSVSSRFRCFGRDRFRHGFVASGESGFVTVSLLRVRAVSSRFRQLHGQLHGFVTVSLLRVLV